MHESEARKSGRRIYIAALFLPLLLGVIICSSTAGVNWLRQERLEVEVEALATADYSPWEQTRFAPIQPRLATQLAADSNGTNQPNYVALGVTPAWTATSDATSTLPTETSLPTLVAQVATDTPIANTATATASATITDTPIATDTALPSITPTHTTTNTPIPTLTFTPQPSATNTPIPTLTFTPRPPATNTPIPTWTFTPQPTSTPQPTATDVIPAPVAAFQVTPATGIAPLNVTITNQSSGQITNYSWNFGDGIGTSTVAAPGGYTYNTPNTYTITLTVTGPGGTRTATRTVTVTAPAQTDADVSLSKLASVTTANVGDTFTYTLTASNAGPIGATSVTITDTLPAQVAFVSSPQCAATGQNITCNLGIIADGGAAAATITVQAISAGSATNTATVNASQPDPNTANNIATATVVISDPPPEADIEIVSYTPSNSTPQEGETITTTLTVRNNGTTPVDNVIIGAASGDLGLTPNNHAPSQGIMNGDNWEVGNLTGGQTVTLVVTSTLDTGTGGTSITRTRSITNTSITDPNSGNNTGSFTLNVQVIADADLNLSKVASVTTATVGETFTYTLTVTNNGPADANNITLVDTLPTQVSYVSGPGACSENSGIVTCVIPFLSGATATASFTYTVQATGTGVATNTANISADEPDSNLGNNTASATVTINAAEADLEFTTFSFDNGNPAVGETITATIEIVNNGPLPATNIRLGDSNGSGALGLPTVLTVSHGTFTGGEWDIPLLNNSETATVTLEITVDAGAAGTTVSRWREIIASDQPDPDSTPGNSLTTEDDYNSYSVTVQPLAQIDLQLTKSAPGTATVNTSFDYTLTVNNVSAANATNVQITDTLPAQVTFVSSPQCSAIGQDVTCNLGTINAGGNTTATITVMPVNQGNATNTATVSSTEPDANPGDNSDSATVNIGPETLRLVSLCSAEPGTQNRWRVDNFNPFPISFTWLEYNNPTPATGTETVPAAVGATRGEVIFFTPVVGTIQIWVPDPATGVVHDTNSPSGATCDIDLALTKTVDNPTPQVGQAFTFTVSVFNGDTHQGSGIQVTDNMPAGLTIQGVPTATHGTYDSGTDTWNLGTLPVGETAILTITATAATPGIYTNTAVISAANQPDANTSNNSDTATVTVSAPPSADIAVSLNVNNTTAYAGTNIIFTLSADNLGPDTATNVQISFGLPAGLVYVSDTSGGAYNSSTGMWTIPSLANGGNAIIQITAQVDGTQSGINVTGSLIGLDQLDTNAANDSSSVIIFMIDVHFEVRISVDNASPTEGEQITYTVTADNYGSGPATGITIDVPLPGGLTYVSDDGGGGYNSTSGVWTIPTLGSGFVFNLQITAQVDVGTLGSAITTTATKTAMDQPDQTTGDDSASVMINVVSGSADVFIGSAGASTNPVPVGNTTTIIVNIGNNGPDTANNVNLSFDLPANLVILSSSCDVLNVVGTTYTCGIATPLTNGANSALTFDIRADAIGSYPLNFVLSATEADSNVGNNSGAVTLTAQ